MRVTGVKVRGTGQPVPASGPKTARVAVVGLAPAKEEIRLGVPFVGASGKQLDQCLELAKTSRAEVYVTNVSDKYIPIGTGVPEMEKDYYEECKRRLVSELSALPNLTTIIALGDALIPFTDKWGITRWRGSILPSTLIPGKRVVPSVHPAWIIRGQWSFRGVLSFDIRRAIEESVKPGHELDLPTFPMITGPSFAQIMDALDYYFSLDETSLVTLDLEMHRRVFIACIGFYDDVRPPICIPFVYATGKPIWSASEEAQIWQKIARFLEHGRARLAGQNLSFDLIRLLWEMKVSMRRPWMDTMHAHHCLMPELPHSLAFMNSIYTRLQYYKDDAKIWDPKVGERTFWEYNCKDVWATYKVAMGLEAELRRDKLWDVYQRCYARRFRIPVRMEYEGIRINREEWTQLRQELEDEINVLQAFVNQQVGFNLNVASPKQMRDYLYAAKRYAPVIKRETGKPTTDKDALQALHLKYGDPLIPKILELRQTLDLKGDIFDQPIGDDNRMRCHYSQTGTETGGRWSSSESVTGSGTNLQNIPRKGPARSMFLPEEGHVFVEADQVQAEAMAVAWMGPVPGLIRLFQSGKDVHLEVAKMIARVIQDAKFNTGGLFMDPWDTLTKETHPDERYVAKRTVHACNYDMGVKKYAMVAGIPVQLAEILLAVYHHQLFPEIRSLYHTGIQQELRVSRTLYVPYFNTRRVFLDYWDQGGELLRAAYAHKPQALVGHITGEIMDMVEDELLDHGCPIRMQVHDSVIVSAPPDLVPYVVRTIDKAAKSIIIPLKGGLLTIPMEYKVGTSYGTLKDYKLV